MSQEENEIKLTRSQIIELIDPYGNNSKKLQVKTNEQLTKHLFDICMNYSEYKHSDYRFSKSSVKEEARRRLSKTETYERTPHAEMKYSAPIVASHVQPERVRAPDPVRRQCLLPSFESAMDNALYESQRDNVKSTHVDEEFQESLKRALENSLSSDVHHHNSKTDAYEESFKKALEDSLKDLEDKRMNSVLSAIEKIESPKETIVEEKPDYGRLLSMSRDFTTEIIDKLFDFLKKAEFVNFRNYLNDLPVSISTIVWRLDYQGDKLKQMVASKRKDVYKCFV